MVNSFHFLRIRNTSTLHAISFDIFLFFSILLLFSALYCDNLFSWWYFSVHLRKFDSYFFLRKVSFLPSWQIERFFFISWKYKSQQFYRISILSFEFNCTLFFLLHSIDKCLQIVFNGFIQTIFESICFRKLKKPKKFEQQKKNMRNSFFSNFNEKKRTWSSIVLNISHAFQLTW
jgi:hypothetical protein